jgi:uncharacterized membrane protein
MSDEQPPSAPPAYPSYPSHPADEAGSGGGNADPGYGGHYAQPEPPIRYEAGEAWLIGFRLFARHAPAFLLVMLLIVVTALVLTGLGLAFADHRTVTSDNAFQTSFDFTTPQLILEIVGSIISTLLGAAMIRGALDAVDGKPVSVGGMFTGWDKLQILVAVIVVRILMVIGLIVLIVPGLIFYFLSWLTNFQIVDSGLPAFRAIGASIRLTRQHVGPLLVTALLAAITNVAGACLIGLGLFVTIPATTLMAAVAFRQLQGRGVVTGSRRA